LDLLFNANRGGKYIMQINFETRIEKLPSHTVYMLLVSAHTEL